MKIFLFLSSIMIFAACSTPRSATEAFFAQLRTGDLLFTVEQHDNPITDVTRGVNGLKIPHVAIFYRHEGQSYALEAIKKGVSLTPIAEYTAKHTTPQGELRVIAGRIRGKWQRQQSIDRALQYVGKPYDDYFLPDDKAIYCSELVQKCYLDHEGTQLFHPIPMEFRNAAGEIPEFWQEFYHKAGLQVPEGEAGSNPGNLSRHPRLQLFYAFPKKS